MKRYITYIVYPSGFTRQVADIVYCADIGDQIRCNSCDKDGYCQVCHDSWDYSLNSRHRAYCLKNYEIVEIMDDNGVVTAWLEESKQ